MSVRVETQGPVTSVILNRPAAKNAVDKTTAEALARITDDERLKTEDLESLAEGIVNLEKHVTNMKKFGIPVVAVVNSFPTDTEAEQSALKAAPPAHPPPSDAGPEGQPPQPSAVRSWPFR